MSARDSGWGWLKTFKIWIPFLGDADLNYLFLGISCSVYYSMMLAREGKGWSNDASVRKTVWYKQGKVLEN